MKLGLQQRLYNAEVRSRRIKMGLSQGELGKKIGVKGNVICHIENLRILSAECPSVVKLAQFFGVTPETLCPPWLKEIARIPRLVRTEKEVEKGGLAFLAHRPGLPAPEPDPESVVFGTYDQEWLERKADELLTPVEKETLFAFIGTGKDTKDIALQMGCIEVTIRTRLNRAKDKLAKAWAIEETKR